MPNGPRAHSAHSSLKFLVPFYVRYSITMTTYTQKSQVQVLIECQLGPAICRYPLYRYDEKTVAVHSSFA